MTVDTIVSRYIYARHTAVNGGSYVQQHLVWDAALFDERRSRDIADLNAKQSPGDPQKARYERITEEQYHAERKRVG